MAAFKRRTMFAITLGVWFAAIGSAAALTYDLNRPVKLPAHGWQVPVDRGPAAVPPDLVEVLDLPDRAPDHPAIAPAAATSGRVRQRPARASAPETEVARPDVVRPISEMHCHEWRDLDVGSGQVQICD